ncbi:MAG: type II toxin-antitoxin system VapC family toxin [Rhodocyclaceae bacterium]|jgi:PIN domain nuclease of toxin-antitoxin system|nr:type II toxin-antitoxin system VapC family toxin [Rhodocyclaceae bacterium]MBK6907051.1 type II toxin-antitoxin system VapC family toxin [Rhodocyclaceae bacterium]
MDLLLDTNAFLRWVNGDEALPMTARLAIDDVRNQVFLSAVSAWEIAIKSNIKKLSLPSPVDRYVKQYMTSNGFLWLPIELTDIAGVEALPLHHRDPFDRLLIAQARARQLTIISSDASFSKYDVPLIA